MRKRTTIRQMTKRFTPVFRKRGRTLRKFSQTIGLVHFGNVNQQDDEHSPIRGFTASLGHKDSHYAVGTYDGFNIRVTNRFDIIRIAGDPNHEQVWTILEIDLETYDLPHVFFVPTGQEGGEYGRIYATQPTMQPINSMILDNKSPEFHGRFQILATPAHAHKVSALFSSPLIVGIANRFWPHGLEIENGKLLIYITQHRLTKTVLETTLASGLWLAETIDEVKEA